MQPRPGDLAGSPPSVRIGAAKPVQQPMIVGGWCLSVNLRVDPNMAAVLGSSSPPRSPSFLLLAFARWRRVLSSGAVKRPGLCDNSNVGLYRSATSPTGFHAHAVLYDNTSTGAILTAAAFVRWILEPSTGDALMSASTIAA